MNFFRKPKEFFKRRGDIWLRYTLPTSPGQFSDQIFDLFQRISPLFQRGFLIQAVHTVNIAWLRTNDTIFWTNIVSSMASLEFYKCMTWLLSVESNFQDKGTNTAKKRKLSVIAWKNSGGYHCFFWEKRLWLLEFLRQNLRVVE